MKDYTELEDKLREFHPDETVEISYYVRGYGDYRVDIAIGDIVEAMKDGGETAVDSLVDEYVSDDFNRNICYGYDLDKFIDQIDEEFEIDLRSYEEDE